MAGFIFTKRIMQQRISVLTIAAEDLPAMKKFYEDIMEWKPVAENKDIVFYKMNGFLFSLCKRDPLAEFIGVNPEGSGFRCMTFGYNVGTEDEVKRLYEDLKNKGVKILGVPSQPPFGGLFFYFEDVEGNILEVACNPYVTLDSDNNATGHQPIDHLA